MARNSVIVPEAKEAMNKFKMEAASEGVTPVATGTGSVSVTGDINAGQAITLATSNGNITYSGTASSATGTTLKALTSGNIESTGLLETTGNTATSTFPLLVATLPWKK